MIYSTLKEVYHVDSFEKEKKKKKKSRHDDEIFTEEQVNLTENAKNLYVPPNTTSFCTSADTLKPIYKASMNNVKPFLDEDLEQYLNFDEMPKPVPKKVEPQQQQPHTAVVVQQPQPQAQQQPQPQAQQQAQQQQQAEQHQIVAVSTKPEVISEKDMFYRNLINIALFVFIGILILFLCDQITEIAINIGMKKTVAILEPYLERYKRDLN